MESKKIEQFWNGAIASNSSLFNGTIYMMTSHDVSDGVLRGIVQPASFASLLYWRDQGFPDAGAVNCFGSAVLRSGDGNVLYGRMGPKTANGGRVYPAGGSFSEDDIAGDYLDVERNIVRELEEETGIRHDECERQPGYLLVRDGSLLSIAAQFKVETTAQELRDRILESLNAMADPELDDIVIIKRFDMCDNYRMPGYARSLIQFFFN